MRRIIVFGIALFCIILTLFTIYTGLPMFKVPRVNDVKTQYTNTTTALGDLKAFKEVTYKAAEGSLAVSVKACKEAKAQYEDAAAAKTEEERENALKTKAYDLEYLWVKVGNYAYNNNVNLQLDVYKSEEGTTDNDYVLCDLKVTCISSYYGVIQFIEQISRDPDLKMIPQNIKLASDWRDVYVELEPKRPLYVDDYFAEIPNPDFKQKLLLVTTFYKTDIPITKSSLLKVENPETVKAEKEAAEKAEQEGTATPTTSPEASPTTSPSSSDQNTTNE